MLSRDCTPKFWQLKSSNQKLEKSNDRYDSSKIPMHPCDLNLISVNYAIAF